MLALCIPNRKAHYKKERITAQQFSNALYHNQRRMNMNIRKKVSQRTTLYVLILNSISNRKVFKLISVLKPFAMFTIFCLLVWSMVFFFLIGPCLLFIHYSCCPRESLHQPSQSKVSMTPMYFSEEAKLPLVVRSDPN